MLSQLNFILLESSGLVIIKPPTYRPHCSARLANCCSAILPREFTGSAARQPGARPLVSKDFLFVPLVSCCYL